MVYIEYNTDLPIEEYCNTSFMIDKLGNSWKVLITDYWIYLIYNKEIITLPSMIIVKDRGESVAIKFENIVKFEIEQNKGFVPIMNFVRDRTPFEIYESIVSMIQDRFSIENTLGVEHRELVKIS